MLYPVNMDRHGPSRTLDEYLSWLYDELDKTPWRSARERDLVARIRAIEEEIDARSDL